MSRSKEKCTCLKGLVLCPDCKGSDKKKFCEKCQSSGVTICSKCGGTGIIKNSQN